MGALTSRQHAGVEEVDVTSAHAYKYPPRSGNYFGTHFIMGGERFDTPQPEAYLFGENSDLNFLGSKPTAFPYPPPQPNEPTKTLKCLVNIRKESLRFVRAPVDVSKAEADGSGDNADSELEKHLGFNIEFVFDSDVRCAITIYYFCTEEVTARGVTYISRNPMLTSETFHYKRGANQHFCQSSHVFTPYKYTEDELLYDVDREIIPVAIHCVAEEGLEDVRQSHTTIAIIEKGSDGLKLKALKQKLFVDGLSYLIQEIYGIENKVNEKIPGDDEIEDSGSECVICMSDTRDTLILPCRHLCLCNSCADSLRYQANNCPICRAPFRALLQVKALQKSGNIQSSPPDASSDNIPPGYEAVSLIEALNGPVIQKQPPSAIPDLIETPESEQVSQTTHLTTKEVENSPPKTKASENNEYSTLMSTPDDDSKENSKLLTEKNNTTNSRHRNSRSPRDTVKIVNEKCNREDNLDEDSEAEKLSPLLQKNNGSKNTSLALNMVEVVEPIDDADTDQDEASHALGSDKSRVYCHNGEERGDDSDYYTPEELAPSVAPLYKTDEEVSSTRSTPQKLPGTPLSHASARSSGESYSSGSSTRHLLAMQPNVPSSSDKVVRV